MCPSEESAASTRPGDGGDVERVIQALAESLEPASLVSRVAELFRDHVDLLRDLEHFLPFEEEDRDGAAKEALRSAVAAAEESAVGRSGKKKRRRR